MPKPFPAEFRADAIAVARKREAPLRQIAKDFGISEACLHRWLKIADRQTGVDRPASAAASDEVSAQLREAHKRIKLLVQEAEGDVPRRRLPVPGRQPKMMYALVLDLADDGVPVTVTCRLLGFSTQAFYKCRKARVSQRDWDDAHLINAARDIHADDPAFGYRFIDDELPGRGITAAENRVARLCSQERIRSTFAKKRELNRRSGPPVHDDLLTSQNTSSL